MIMKYKLPQSRPKTVKSTMAPYFDRTRGNIIPGSHRLQWLLSRILDDKVLRMPAVLVGGSNGKGTTCAFIESIIREHGLVTGLYTSPHLIHPNERIRINGIPISETKLENYLKIVDRLSKCLLPDASFFELITATAFVVFYKEKIDFLVCEVGLGGHFDSTNSISPLLSVITSISLEHTEFLGDSLFKIACDKAFISRRNKHLIIGDIADEAVQGIKHTAKIIGSSPVFCSNSTLNENLTEIVKYFSTSNDFVFPKINLPNLITALNSIQYLFKDLQIEINIDKVKKGIQKTFWPGRFDVRQICGRNVIFDASHNSDGFKYFLNAYNLSSFSSKKFVLIFCSLKDKDWKKTLLLLPFEKISAIIFTEVPILRSEKSSELAKFYKENIGNCISHDIENFELALETGMNLSFELPLVITGSIAFIGLVMERFNLNVFEDMSE
ncbi:MAG: hypothetical protein DCC88_01475 [Spirobacillus cienkowskii]|jgi:dihydrofolate synthase/folylpolyglutamate synthase|uniref:Mur ligase central domain-containing protein n=1 Tax=Spirobacillus cienkowskii TaxID=495820 RepID=A0A369L101_9BACT|nr:MAG: hypothetical protein DCC88_01475 [Spirobacillus cienkowskii]